MPSNLFKKLLLPRSIHDEMIAHALEDRPNECCGLLAGHVREGIAHVIARLPLINELASERRYLSEPKSLLTAHRRMRDEGWIELAVYHSHPTSEAIPSRTDLAEWFYGETAICFIVTLVTRPPTLRGWWLDETGSREADWRLLD